MASLCGVKVWLFVALILVITKESLQSVGPGFIFESDEYVYKVVYERDDNRTFYEAEESCRYSENGHLASITSSDENEWLHRKIQSLAHMHRPARFWVGASDQRRFGYFEWLDGKPFFFYAAHYLGARNPRKKQENEMCLLMTSSNKDVSWAEDDCYNAKGYICKTEGPPKRLTAYRRFGFQFEDEVWTYKFIISQDYMLSWPEADLYCRKTEWGGLLSISDEKDNEKIASWLKFLRSMYGFSKLWIGATDLASDGQFYWKDGNVYNYTNWKEGEPSAINNGKEQDCVAISGQHNHFGQWSDEYCLERLPYICKIKMCGDRTDLAFAIDASGSMGDAGFAKAKQFVRALTQSFKVSHAGTHVGLIRFSTRAKVIFDFNSYFSHEEVNNAIDDVQYTEGGTRTELALQLARQRLFSTSGGYRAQQEIFKILVLLTDGRSESRRKVERESTLLKQRGVHVLAVGIGKSTNQQELETIATSKSDVIGVVSFKELMVRMNDIKDKLCEVASENERLAKQKAKEKTSLDITEKSSELPKQSRRKYRVNQR